VNGSVREEEAAGAPEAVVLDVRADEPESELELELVGTDAVDEELELDEELEVGAGALPVDDELGVLEASGSTYCWLPADCASAAGAAYSARTAQSRMALHALHRRGIV
jgi:hypothetical protein